MLGIRYVIAALVCILFLTSAVSNELVEPEAYSRQELFGVMKRLTPGELQFALPPEFVFPNSVRNSSTFGVDISHNNELACKCLIKWDGLINNGVRFVYLKATQGAAYVDQTGKRAIKALRESEASGHINVGMYHFLTASDRADTQADNFLRALGVTSPQDLPPSLDLEWDLGPWEPTCPSNATVQVRVVNGYSRKCDQWSRLSAVEIMTAVNAWIDRVKAATGRDVILYTNAVWWTERIGSAGAINNVKTQLIWIADYSASGLGTERPRVPANRGWQLWQFSDTAKINDGSNSLVLDASIFEGRLDLMYKELGIPQR